MASAAYGDEDKQDLGDDVGTNPEGGAHLDDDGSAAPLAPPTITLTVAPKDDDAQSHLPDSIQIEQGSAAVLSWTTENATAVELSFFDGATQLITDGSTSLELTPDAEENDYAMVALSGDRRSAPAYVHVSTHPPGAIYSPHAEVSPATDDTAAADAPLDDESRRYEWVKSIITKSLVIDWRKKKKLGNGRFDSGPWKMNILALAGWIDGKGKVDKVRDRFSDTFYVAYRDGDGKRCCEAFIGTTVPGHQTDETIKAHGYLKDGNSHVLPNQNRYKRGLHDGENGNNQAEPFYYWNDAPGQHSEIQESDHVAFNGPAGGIGLNNHQAGRAGNWTVGYCSTGCQVVRGDYEKTGPTARYFWLMNQDPVGVIKYTLYDTQPVGIIRDVLSSLGGDLGLDDCAAEMATLSPSIDETAKRQPQMKGAHDKSWKRVLELPQLAYFDRSWNTLAPKDKLPDFYQQLKDSGISDSGVADDGSAPVPDSSPQPPAPPPPPPPARAAAPAKAAAVEPATPADDGEAAPVDGELASVYMSAPEIVAWYSDTSSAPITTKSPLWKHIAVVKQMLQINTVDSFQKKKGVPVTGDVDRATALLLDQALLEVECPKRFPAAVVGTTLSDDEDKPPALAQRCIDVLRYWESNKVEYATTETPFVHNLYLNIRTGTPPKDRGGLRWVGSGKANCSSSTFASFFWATHGQVNGQPVWLHAQIDSAYSAWQIFDRKQTPTGAAEAAATLGIGAPVELTDEEKSSTQGNADKLKRAMFDKLRPGDLVQGWHDATSDRGHSFFITKLERDADGHVNKYWFITANSGTLNGMRGGVGEQYHDSLSSYHEIYAARFFKLEGEA